MLFHVGHLVLTIKGDCRERLVEVAERLRMNAYAADALGVLSLWVIV